MKCPSVSWPSIRPGLNYNYLNEIKFSPLNLSQISAKFSRLSPSPSDADELPEGKRESLMLISVKEFARYAILSHTCIRDTPGPRRCNLLRMGVMRTQSARSLQDRQLCKAAMRDHGFRDGYKKFVPISRRMQLAANRQVTREEDEIYSLVGLLGVEISVAYGEGSERAIVRLMREVLNSKEHVSDIFNHRYDMPAIYYLLNDNLYKDGLAGKLPIENGECPDLPILVVLNFGSSDDCVVFPKTCLSLTLRCGRNILNISPSDVDMEILPVSTLVNFQLQFDDGYTLISKDKLGKNGMRLVTLYL